MGPIAFFRSVYDVGSLDTRFTTPSNVPYEPRNDGGGDRERPVKPDPRAQPPKWAWPEFRFYVLFVYAIVPYMYWIAGGVSRGTLSCSGPTSQVLKGR